MELCSPCIYTATHLKSVLFFKKLSQWILWSSLSPFQAKYQNHVNLIVDKAEI